MIFEALLALSLIADKEPSSKDESFEFYFEDYATNSLTAEDPLLLLIEKKLAESIFSSPKDEDFAYKIRKLQELSRDRPDMAPRLKRLNGRLQREFNTRVKDAKVKRTYYTIGGAVVGALIGIPIGRAIGGSWTSKAVWIAVPVSALAGAGGGYLLGNLLEMPAYDFSRETLAEEIDPQIEKIDELIEAADQ